MERDLRLDDVGRRYGLRGPWVLRNVHLELAPGSLTRIDGPNGSGKSTLLRLLAGIDAPTEGRVTGRPRTAYVPERFPAALPFTAVGYLTHLGTVHGLPRASAERAADEWLDRFGAAAYARTPMTRLSKGSSQKVAVAQALLAEPELLILDEAWTGLDTDARTELERAVAERTAAGSAVVFVDHDPRRLADVADTVYTVRDSGLHRRTGEEPTLASDGPHVIVEVHGAAALLPADALRLAVLAEETAEGTHWLTVPASHSDVLLRALLTARPPWHVASVRRDESRGAGRDESGDASRDAGEDASRDQSRDESRR
ncbi:ATP-binding cassette domain-containing protein [Streptomyces sp. LUP30]|uniref:ATP-binding cassette domain-containing protein n=1 Tax=Streptomyces sp. LUP30 TaxID=1890285 RepID=UPI00099F5703|nr:ATP-binding cassette domain-containing protein [Streptomyces sp. LUP30]